MLRDVVKLVLALPFVYVAITFFGTMAWGVECLLLNAIHVDPPIYALQLMGLADTVIFGWMTVLYIARWNGWK